MRLVSFNGVAVVADEARAAALLRSGLFSKAEKADEPRPRPKRQRKPKEA